MKDFVFLFNFFDENFDNLGRKVFFARFEKNKVMIWFSNTCCVTFWEEKEIFSVALYLSNHFFPRSCLNSDRCWIWRKIKKRIKSWIAKNLQETRIRDIFRVYFFSCRLQHHGMCFDDLSVLFFAFFQQVHVPANLLSCHLNHFNVFRIKSSFRSIF